MRIWDKVKGLLKFGSTPEIRYQYDRPIGKSIVSGLIANLSSLSRFDQMSMEDIYEQIYAYEPEIGGAIDRLSSLVALSYKGFTLKNVGDTLEEDERRVLELATQVSETYNFTELFETLTELLLIYGNVYLLKEKTNSGFPKLTILPNKNVTILDSKDRLGRLGENVITSAKYYVLNEADPKGLQKIYSADQIIHIKYKDTPVFLRDRKNRLTYGIYSISPLMRAVFPVWWKREAMIIDILWRYRNIPREHHIISSESFDLRNYTGTVQERLQAAKQDAENTIRQYGEMIKEQEPDHGYVTLDTVTIKTIDPSGGKYASPNELITQMTEYLWMAMNIPESVVSGRSRSSYASELVVSGYLTAKVIRIAEKIKNALLKFTKEVITYIDDTLPVDKLDIKLELILETSKMELYRQAAIMADLGVFTRNEIRAHLGYGELPEDELVVSNKPRKAGDKSIADVVNDVVKSDEPSAPMTPQSEEQTKKP